jgi:hypothetical protein
MFEPDYWFDDEQEEAWEEISLLRSEMESTDNHVLIIPAKTFGTFSLTDTHIEFVLQDSTIFSREFSRTENTITIGDMQFSRK